MIITGTIQDLKDLKTLLELSNCRTVEDQLLKIKHLETINNAIKDEEFERDRNFVFTTDEDF